MNILNDFAEAMAQYEQSRGIPAGYQIAGKKPYPYYMSNEAWVLFRNGMDPKIRAQFEAGNGGEMDEKNNSSPPKMAAFHSSSRLVYHLSRDCADFQFEKQLPTLVGGSANLDGYISRPDRIVFVEAKCREPYGHKSPESISDKYIPVYTYLKEKMPAVFGFEASPTSDGKHMVSFTCKGDAVKGFDIKQMIYHLLAVAAHLLSMKKLPERVDFLYLIFNPSALPLTEKCREQVMGIYQETVASCIDLNVELMFCHIVNYLISVLNIKNPVDPECLKKVFHFELCDQYSYTGKLL